METTCALIRNRNSYFAGAPVWYSSRNSICAGAVVDDVVAAGAHDVVASAAV